MHGFHALVVRRSGQGASTVVERRERAALASEEVRIRVEYSGLNYKDALALDPASKVIRDYPRVPGIDLAGEVIESRAASIPVGSRVLAHGYGIGVTIDGGLQEEAVVPAAWTVPLGDLQAREAMAIGTAGFTAAMSVMRLRAHGVTPGSGDILVTGANGGVGGMAVAMLSHLGFTVVASTGTADAAARLRTLGASEVVGRFGLADSPPRPLASERWAAVVDSTGGGSLAEVLAQVGYGGIVACSGLTAGHELRTTVMPFVLRGVTLAGIDSVQFPIEARRSLWREIESEMRFEHMDVITHEVSLDEVPRTLQDLGSQRHSGRTVVRLLA